MRVVCVGDSITAGQYCDSAWPDHLEPVYDVLNKGVNGDTTRTALERFPADVQEQNADIVVIQFGHNDANRWDSDRGLHRVSLGAFKANLTEMVERCRAFDAHPVLCSIPPARRDVVYERDLLVYDHALADVSEALSVPLVPVRGHFLLTSWPTLLLDDGLHLSRAGHEVYGRTVAETLERMLVVA